MANITIGPNQLQNTIMKILDDLPKEADEAVEEATKTVAKKAVDDLKATSPVGTGKKAGSYANGWGTKKQKGKTVVYNKTDYQLTHLLEYGHQLVIHGKVTNKSTRAIPHIKQVEQMVQNEYPKEFEKELQERL